MLRIFRHGDVIRFDLARTLIGGGHYWTTAYLVDGLLIDTGCEHTSTELVDELEGTPIRQIVNTHSHEDHIGGNAPLQRQRNGLGIVAHPLALPILADPRGLQPLNPYRKVMWGWPEPSSATPIDEGDVIETEHRRFEVLHTPGHSPDHLCLYERDQGWLFTGDLYVGGRDRALRASYDVWGIIESLNRVAGLPAETLFPGCAKVRTNPSDVLRAKIEYLQTLGEQVLELSRQGSSVGEIARRLMGGPLLIELLTLGHFSRRRLVLSYLGRNPETSRPSR